MDSLVIVNCKTGDVVHREMTPEENAQRQRDAADHARREQDRQAKEAAREGVLTAVAQKLGVPTDDLKDALGVGRSTPQPDPNRPKNPPRSQ